jgi:hypothetical protein
MKLSRVRFTVRRRVVMVAITGLLISLSAALVAHTKSQADPLHLLLDFDRIRVSPLERFLIGILLTAAACAAVPLMSEMSIRRLMHLVAASAIVPAAIYHRCELQGLWRTHRDRASYAGIASLNRCLELSAFQKTVGCAVLVDPAAESDPEYRRWCRLANYHGILAKKYERATSRSWLPVAPDSPEPK